MKVQQQQQQQSGAFASTATAQQQQYPEFSFNDEPIFSTSTSNDPVQATVDDFFSSPEWTDPSPALTSSLSFNVESCDTSPLLTDVNEAPEYAGMPLFNDHLQNGFGGFAQMAFQRPSNVSSGGGKSARSGDESTLMLLRAFNNSVINNTSSGSVSPDEVITASPATILSPLPSNDEGNVTSTGQNRRGVKRRIDATDLLPMDAPIQPRKYKTPSATSRKDSFEQPSTPELTSSNGEGSVAAKRLSNTLAARRSRHRKAEELRQLHETIEDLQSQVEILKQRCFNAEQERDDLRRSSTE